MNPVTCPRCNGRGEEYEPASDVECRPPQWWPCALCDGMGEVLEYMADVYVTGRWRLGVCDGCGETHVIVASDGEAELCKYCWQDLLSVPF
jgi:RecJ-like exonuclease